MGISEVRSPVSRPGSRVSSNPGLSPGARSHPNLRRDSVPEPKAQRATHEAEPEPNVITHQDPTKHLHQPAPEPRDDASPYPMGQCNPAHIRQFAELFNRGAQIGVVGPEDD